MRNYWLKKYLLIISCGKKKDPKLKTRKLKAEEAYIGPMFQVIQKAKREGRWIPFLFLGIISAKYGFLRGNEYIEYYDLKMTTKIAKKHNLTVLSRIKKWNEEEQFDFIYVLMGKAYLNAVHGIKEITDANVRIENMGGLGFGQQKLLHFLDEVSKLK